MIRLKSKIEKHFGVRFSSFPGEENKNGFYYPKRDGNASSTRFWVSFKQNPEGNVCIVGDFETDTKKVFKVIEDIGKLKLTAKIPKNKEYKKQRTKIRRRFKRIINSLKRGAGRYLEDFKKVKRTVYKSGALTVVPFMNLGEKERVQAILKIDPKGGKMFLRGSEAKGNVHWVRRLKNENGFIYVCEGIKTAYAIAQSVEEVAVLSVGSLNNMDNILKQLKTDKKYKKATIVLTTEKGSHSQYLNLKYKRNTKLVGSSKHKDIAHFFEEFGEEETKKLLTTFQSKLYIPLGINTERNSLQIYLKSHGSISEYKRGDADILFSDCHEISTEPDPAVAKKFYYEIRALSRLIGRMKTNNYISTGIFVRGENFFFYDGVQVYFLRRGKLIEMLPEEIISSETLFIRNEVVNYKSLNKFPKLTKKEFLQILGTMQKVNCLSNEIEYKLLLGWAVSAVLCGGIPFRTHVWLTGHFSSGKSSFVESFIMTLIKYKEQKVGRSTTAKFVERIFSSKAIAFYHDEFEPMKDKSHDSYNMLELHRSVATNRDSSTGKAIGATEKVTILKFCYSAIITSIKHLNELGSADISRYVFFEVKKRFYKGFQGMVKDYLLWIKTESIPDKFLKTCLLSHSEFLKEYDKVFEWVSTSDISAHRQRAVATLVAGFNVISTNGKKIKKRETLSFLEQNKNQAVALAQKGESFLESTLEMLVPKDFTGEPTVKTLKECLKIKRIRAELRPYLKVSKGTLYFFHDFYTLLEAMYTIKRDRISKEAMFFAMQNDKKYLIKMSVRTIQGKKRRRSVSFDLKKYKRLNV